MSTPLDAFKFKKQNLLLWLILSILILVLAVLYGFGWSQSNFKCPNLSRPLQHPFDSSEQIKACRSFKDLDNFWVSATKNQLDKIIAERKKSGANLTYDQASKYVFGRAKIEEYARRNNIKVNDVAINDELETAYKQAGGQKVLLSRFSLEEVKAQIRGVLLQRAVENKATTYRYADWVAIRWDVVRPEVWQPKTSELREEAKSDLAIAKESLKNEEVSAKEAAAATTIDQTKFGFNIGNRQKLYKKVGLADPYVKALSVKSGVSDIFCDGRFCAVFRILKGNNGKYESMADFMGDLKGW